VSLPSVKILIDKLIQSIRPYFPDSQDPADQPIIVANIIHQSIAPDTELGRLNISFYRDDFTTTGLHPTVEPSSLTTNIDGKTIILVDDVIYSGRTIRAAMNEIFDYGRPEQIILAILVDRGERSIPIQPDIVAETIQLEAGSHIKLSGPEPLQLNIKTQKEIG
jgi:pyrimidine operon attenuation protein/uracil phosphoribosyltransferase